jgi:hypothetical protein
MFPYYYTISSFPNTIIQYDSIKWPYECTTCPYTNAIYWFEYLTNFILYCLFFSACSLFFKQVAYVQKDSGLQVQLCAGSIPSEDKCKLVFAYWLLTQIIKALLKGEHLWLRCPRTVECTLHSFHSIYNVVEAFEHFPFVCPCSLVLV